MSYRYIYHVGILRFSDYFLAHQNSEQKYKDITGLYEHECKPIIMRLKRKIKIMHKYYGATIEISLLHNILNHE